MICLLFLLTGCSFEDKGCIISGTLIAYPVPPSPTVEKGNLLYYPLADVQQQTLYGSADIFVRDTLRRDLPSGRYDLLYYQKGVNKIEGLQGGAKAVRLTAPTYDKQGIVYHLSEQTYIASSLKEAFWVPEDADVLCPFNVGPLVQQIKFFITIKGRPHVIDFMTASLFGVTVDKSVAFREKGKTHAVQEFALTKESNVLLRKDLYVLGMNNAISNLLYLYTTFDGGTTSVHEVDLSSVFASFTKDVLEIHLSIDLDKYLTSNPITIEEWRTVDYPNFVFIPHN